MSDLIARLDELHAKATAGPWEADGVRDVHGPKGGGNTGIQVEANADWIAAVHNAWPRISAVLRAAQYVHGEHLQACPVFDSRPGACNCGAAELAATLVALDAPIGNG